MNQEVHLAVVGGPDGYAAAIRAGQRDMDVLLVEKAAIGGTCLNRGCIPSKAFVSAAERVENVLDAQHMGITADVDVDHAQLVAWKDEVVDTLTGGVDHLCTMNGVDLVEGVGRFTSDEELFVDSDGGAVSVAFDDAVVATGSRPIAVPSFEFDGDRILDFAEALALEEVPDELLIIGAGYIGMGLATVFAKFGADVQVVEMLDRVLPTYPEHLGAPVRERADELGISFAFGETARSWEGTDSGISVLTETEDVQSSTYVEDKALVAVGREPVTDSLGLENTDAVLDDGFIDADALGRTASDSIAAVGDVVGNPMLAHAATHEALAAVDRIAGHSPPSDPVAVPAVVFTDPEVARADLSEDEATERGLDPVVGEFPFRANGRSLTTDSERGFVRLIADANSGFVVGGEVVGPEASELIGEIMLAIEMGATLEDLAATVHVHPSLSGATMEAAEHAMGTAIHTGNE